jgi:hypothetical protein
MYIVPDADFEPEPDQVTACDLTVVVLDSVLPLDAADAVIDATLGEIVFVPDVAAAVVSSLVEPDVYT